MYIVINIRLDIAFATLRLTRFNVNPSPKYYTEADRAIRYLVGIRSLALQLRGGDTFEVASNALFVDNLLDQKSS